MAYRLIGPDCLITIALGGLANGGPFTFASPATNIKAISRRIKIDEEVKMVDVSGLGDGLEMGRAKRSKATLDVEMFVSSAGLLLADKVGYALKMTVTPVTGGTAESFVGTVTKRGHEAPDDAQVEMFTMETGLEGWAYTSVYA